jgi:hypothetical protein
MVDNRGAGGRDIAQVFAGVVGITVAEVGEAESDYDDPPFLAAISRSTCRLEPPAASSSRKSVQ